MGIFRSLGGIRYWLSPNYEILIYAKYGDEDILRIQYLSTGEEKILQDLENCWFGAGDLSWNPDSNKIALSCGDNLRILTIPEFKDIGRITKQINFAPDGTNTLFHPSWSPDGKWIAYYINTGKMNDGERGPYITEASCLSDDATCPGKTKLYVNRPYHLYTWTSESNLAILEPRTGSLEIFRIPSFYLISKLDIDIPGHVDSLIWSNNEEWLAMGAGYIYIASSKTGEVRKISKQAGDVLFWLEIKK